MPDLRIPTSGDHSGELAFDFGFATGEANIEVPPSKPRVNPAPGENRAYPANGISFSDGLAMICTRDIFGDC